MNAEDIAKMAVATFEKHSEDVPRISMPLYFKGAHVTDVMFIYGKHSELGLQV